MQDIAEHLPITEGVDRLMYVLKKYGYKIAILSGGFTYFGQYLQQKYGIDYVYANELEIVDGKLTGRYLGDVVDGKRKAELLRLMEPMIFRCWVLPVWVSLYMLNPKWLPMPNSPSIQSGSMEYSIS